MKNPAKLNLLLPLLLLLIPALTGQDLASRKDQAYPQVAVGPTIETRITLTNRGTFDYSGTLEFTQGAGEFWNPLVNGVRISDSQFPVSIPPDETLTLRITDSELVSGAAFLLSNDLFPDNFVESSLTYFFLQDGRITDAVGVLPAEDFYLASLPFDDFDSVGLALANSDLFEPQATEVLVTLLDRLGEVVAETTLELLPFEHRARFLFELFPNVELSRGKVEIFALARGDSAPAPIVGTALSVQEGQVSALPLRGSPVAYTANFTGDDGRIIEGVIAFWAEGFFIRGYLALTSIDGAEITPAESPLFLVSGQLVDSFLDLTFFLNPQQLFADSSAPAEGTFYLPSSGFGFDLTEVNGRWHLTQGFDTAPEVLSGDYALERITP